MKASDQITLLFRVSSNSRPSEISPLKPGPNPFLKTGFGKTAAIWAPSPE